MSLKSEEQTEAVLKTLQMQAAARNMEFAEYLRLFAQAGQFADSGAELSIDEFESLLQKVSEGVPVLPALPSDFSRADVYAGRD